MNITTASALIASQLESGSISQDLANRAQFAIRESSYYGQRMTADDRRRMLKNRFGIEA